jgi:hypothetical protein
MPLFSNCRVAATFRYELYRNELKVLLALVLLQQALSAVNYILLSTIIPRRGRLLRYRSQNHLFSQILCKRTRSQTEIMGHTIT